MSLDCVMFIINWSSSFFFINTKSSVFSSVAIPDNERTCIPVDAFPDIQMWALRSLPEIFKRWIRSQLQRARRWGDVPCARDIREDTKIAKQNSTKDTKQKYQPPAHPCCIWGQLLDGWTQGYLANISLRLRAHSLEMKLYDIAEGIHKVEPCDNYSEEECKKACLRRRRT